MSQRLLVKDRRGERELLLVGTITIGRDPHCEISDTDAQLSRRHAEICVSEQGVIARDLNSRNGMLVNGRRLLEAVLHPGDVVQVASLAVTFVSATSEPVAVSMPPVQLSPPRAAASAPPLPETAVPEDDRTGLMSPAQVAEAALASMGRAGSSAVRRDPPAGDAQDARPPVPVVPLQTAAAIAPVERVLPQRSESTDAARVAGRGPAEGRSQRTPAPAVQPGQRERMAGPEAGPTADAAMTWTASVTWQVGTLAAVSCLVGAASVLPWRTDLTAGRVPAGMLLVPLIGLLAALGAGFLVAARVRRAALAAFGVLATRVRAAADGEAERVSDPLGTKPTGELAAAINDILARARRA